LQTAWTALTWSWTAPWDHQDSKVNAVLTVLECRLLGCRLLLTVREQAVFGCRLDGTVATVLRNDFIYWYPCYRSAVCLSRLCIVLNLFLSKFCHKVTHSCWFEHRTHSVANCGQMVRDNIMVTIRGIDFHAVHFWGL